MSVDHTIRSVMNRQGWFPSIDRGIHVLFDGQYGSTGKGLLAGVIAEAIGDRIWANVTSSGPNSGHTVYYDDKPFVFKQLPTAGVVRALMGDCALIHLNAGAVISPDVLFSEMQILYKIGCHLNIVVDPCAAVVSGEHLQQNQDIASTGMGVGPALAYKIGRKLDCVAMGSQKIVDIAELSRGLTTQLFISELDKSAYAGDNSLVEVAQGWSLGINSGFYPYVTARECSVAQGIADCGTHPRTLRKSIASLRTYPIRVGNTDQGSSGPVYWDQEEIDWKDIGQEPEYTTVTGRQRRLFTWSWQQFEDMLHANDPDALFLNFVQYIEGTRAQERFIDAVLDEYWNQLNRNPDFILLGYGPRPGDVECLDTSL